MLCDDCKKKPASVHFTKIIHDQKVEKKLCKQCTENYSGINFSNFELNFNNKFLMQNLLKGIFKQSFNESRRANSETVCQICKMTYSDFSRSGKIGCSNCYKVFGDSLESIMRRVHSTCRHIGKAPARAAQKLSIKRKYNQLRRELDRLVGREEYETAAKIRDEIKKLEQS